jgi:hypothetical protein
MRKHLIPTLFLISCVACSPLRHYQKVALDPFRSAQERELLAKAANEEFPEYISDTQQVSIVVDSTEVQRLNEAYNALVDEFVKHQEDDTIQEPRTIGTSNSAKLYAELLQKMQKLKPATITKTITKEIKVRDGAWAEVKQKEVNVCREELRLMTFQKDELKTKNKNKLKIIYYLGGFLLLLMAIVIWRPHLPRLPFL